MTQITLSYFDMPASRGEECRLALTLAGVDFVDDRIAYQDWPARKASTPYGSVPILTVEGKGVLAHSNAILNYIGAKYGLSPSDPWQAALHNGVMDAVEEMRIKVWPVLRQGGTEEEKIAIRTEFVKSSLLPWAEQIEKQIKGPFVCGELIQVADLKIWSFCQWFKSGAIDHVPTTIFDPYQRLSTVHRKVAEEPKVAAFRARHAK